MSESKELSVPERAAVALGAAEHEKSLIELSKKYADIVSIKNPAGREQAHAAYMTLKNARIAIEKAGKDARDDAVKFGKAVISEEKRLIEITQAEEARLQKLRDVWDVAVEVERQAKADAEQTRINGIRTKIAETQGIPAMMIGWTAKALSQAIEALEATQVALEDYAEFSGEMELVKIATVQKLGDMLTRQIAHEAEQARLAAEREALERQRAELAERERVAAEERAAQEKKDRAARLEQGRRDREVREQEEADRREAQRRAQEAMDAEREAHEARMAEQRAQLEREQSALAAERRRHMEEAEAAKAAQDRIAREAAEKAEAAAQAKRDEIAAAELAEAVRQMEARQAVEAEAARRERVQFELNGPGDVEIVKRLAADYGVCVGDVMQWMKKFDYAAADEQLAAENVAANHMEKAA